MPTLLGELIAWGGAVPFILVTVTFFWKKLSEYQRFGLIVGVYILSWSTGAIAYAVFKVSNDTSALIAGIYAPTVYCLGFVLCWYAEKKRRTWAADKYRQQVLQLKENRGRSCNHDQVALARFAIRARDQVGCDAALDDLETPELLSKVALKGRHRYARLSAVCKMKDQPLLAQVAIQSKHDDIGKAAIVRLKDQHLLAKVATEARTLTAKKAIERITDKSILKNLATTTTDMWVRMSAVESIEDVALLRQIAGNDKDELVRKKAMKVIQGLEALRQAEEMNRQRDNSDQNEVDNLLAQATFKDFPESRTPEEFENLAKVKDMINEDSAQCFDPGRLPEDIVPKSLNIRGRDLILYNDFLEFSKAAIEQRDAAIKLNRNLSYLDVMQELAKYMQENAPHNSFEKAVSKGALVCESCQHEYPFETQMQAMSDESNDSLVCPQCGSIEALYAYSNPDSDDVTIEDIKILKAYSRHYAQLYWEKNSNLFEIAHVCGEIIKRGNGFSHFGSDITCEKCFKKAWGSDEEVLDKIKNNRDYFGAGLLDKARKWSQTHKGDFLRFCAELGYKKLFEDSIEDSPLKDVSSQREIEYHEFINEQVIFKYPIDWEECAAEYGMLFAPPDAKLLGDEATGQQDRDLGLYLVLSQVQEEKDPGQMIDQLISLWKTNHPPYPNFNLLSVQKTKIKGARAACLAQYSYQMGDCLFNGTYLLAEKGLYFYTVQLFGTPERLNELGNIKDEILNSLKIC